jgi:cytochrome c peroxidase
MAEDTQNNQAQAPKANPDEVALELMKFIAVTTGYGKGISAAGFTGKAVKSNEDYADSLLELFERCRTAVRKEPKKA